MYIGTRINIRDLVRGCIFNKFRGDKKILEPGFTRIRKLTGMPVLGLVPYVKTNLARGGFFG